MLEENCGEIEEEVLNKFKVEDSKREACKGRGAPLEWRNVRRSKRYRPRKWAKIAGQEISRWFREFILRRKQGMQKDSTEEDKMKLQRLQVMKGMTR